MASLFLFVAHFTILSERRMGTWAINDNPKKHLEPSGTDLTEKLFRHFHALAYEKTVLFDAARVLNFNRELSIENLNASPGYYCNIHKISIHGPGFQFPYILRPRVCIYKQQ